MTPTEEAVPPADVTPVAVPLPESPGQTLKRARERAGVTLEDLAAQIKLNKATLEALEADDFETLRESVYVRGYYRKVAKVLPVSDQVLIAAYDARVRPSAPPPPKRVPLAGGMGTTTTSRTGNPNGLYLAVGAGLFFGLVVWLGSGSEPAKPTSTVVSLTPADVEPAPAPVEPMTADPATNDAPATTAPVTGAVAVPATAPALTELVMSFSEASWVRVEDSRNKTLLIGLVRAGERKSLQGETPYTVFIGNAQKVKVEFGGLPFDFSRHMQNDTARFTVP